MLVSEVTKPRQRSRRRRNETMDLFHVAVSAPFGEPTPDYSSPRRENTKPAPKMQPDPEWVRGRCPECGEPLISNMYYTAGRGYLIAWECWGGMSENPTCGYRLEL